MNIKHLKTLFIVQDQIEYMMLPVSTVPIRLHGRGRRLADLDLESPEPGHASPIQRQLGFQRLRKKDPKVFVLLSKGIPLVHW